RVKQKAKPATTSPKERTIKMKRRILLSCTMLTLLVGGLAYQTAPSHISEAATPPPSEQIVTVPLFLLTKEWAYFYTADPNEKATLEGTPGWHYQRISCYVIPNSKQVPGSVG